MNLGGLFTGLSNRREGGLFGKGHTLLIIVIIVLVIFGFGYGRSMLGGYGMAHSGTEVSAKEGANTIGTAMTRVRHSGTAPDMDTELRDSGAWALPDMEPVYSAMTGYS